MAKESYEQRMQRLEGVMHEALTARDPARYFQACNDIGYSPSENYEKQLYAQGEMEMQAEDREQTLDDMVDGKDRAVPAKVHVFLAAAERIPLGNTSASAVRKKRDLMMTCFPKLAKGGKDDLSRISLDDDSARFGIHVRYERILKGYRKKYGN